MLSAVQMAQRQLWHHRAGNEPNDGNAEITTLPNSFFGSRLPIPLFGTSKVGAGSLSWHNMSGRKDEKTLEVASWLGEVQTGDRGPPTPPNGDTFVGVGDPEPLVGHETEKKPLACQTYFINDEASLNSVDFNLTRETTPWNDAPSLLKVQRHSNEPVTSQAAIEKFGRLCNDHSSVVSRAATWGTRRRSPPDFSRSADVTRDMCSKKLSFSSRTDKCSSPSRTGTRITDISDDLGSSAERSSNIESPSALKGQPSPPTRRVLYSSNSDIATKSAEKTQSRGESRPTFPSLLLAHKAKMFELGDEDNSVSGSPSPGSVAAMSIDGFIPKLEGFQKHVLKLDPTMGDMNTYLRDRITHHYALHYRLLLAKRIEHLSHVQERTCASGSLCIASGGSSVRLNTKGTPVGSFDDENDTLFPVTEDMFPEGIPIPLCARLPAELECHICYRVIRIFRPSEWTKHVLEDLQPYACTFPGCPDSTFFERKADWVRHENKCHRDLESWKCNLKDCGNVYHRLDIFLAHLVRRHKLPSPGPQVETKVIKRFSRVHPTWRKVEQCHQKAQSRPEDEPCRFCGTAFPSWNELTDHLGEHMEQIAFTLPKLVAMEDLPAGVKISPGGSPRLTVHPWEMQHHPSKCSDSKVSVVSNSNADLKPSSAPTHGQDVLQSMSLARSDFPDTASNTDPINPKTIPEKRISWDCIVSGTNKERRIAFAPEKIITEAHQPAQAAEASAAESVVSTSSGASIDEASARPSSLAEPTQGDTLDQQSTGAGHAELQVAAETSRRACSARQIGVAKIRIELLSIHKPNDTCDSETSESFSAAELNEALDNAEGQSRNGSGDNIEPSEGASSDLVEAAEGQSGGSGFSENNEGGSGLNEDGNGGREGGSRKRRRLKSPERMNTRPRFACPYQAFEPFLDCLQRGPRNPNGGCDGIYRLKQHLSRRHILSFRCQKCWRSFDTRAKQGEHVQNFCQARVMLPSERFMDASHETEIDSMCSSTSEEDTWWKLFRLLIPGMDKTEDSLMRGSYQPYYIDPKLSMPLPSLNFTDVTFSQLENTNTLNELASSWSLIPQDTELLPSDQPLVVSQILSIPIFESTQQLPQPLIGSTAYLHESWTDSSGAPTHSFLDSQTGSNGGMTQATSIQTAPSQAESSSLMAQPPSTMVSGNVTQLKRNNERLKARNQQTVSEIAELRDRNRAALADIRSADGILEGLMNLGDLPDNMYESLEKLSNLIEAASEKLRRRC